MNKKMTSPALVGAFVLASCGGGSDAEPFDVERACRVGNRLVEETAAGDRNGVIRQIERLDDLDGIADTGLDVDDLDSLAENLDEQSVEDLVAEFDVLDCALAAPDFATSTTAVPETTAVPDTITTRGRRGSAGHGTGPGDRSRCGDQCGSRRNHSA